LALPSRYETDRPMRTPEPHPSLYEQLEALPPGLTGEILNGQLHTQPRPAAPHVFTASSLGFELTGPFDRGHGGPGGWWIVQEPELHLLRDIEVDVPDLAGWRKERMPTWPTDHRFTVVPDWVCEILSPSTESKDRDIKMPIYARFGVPFAWLIDPRKHTLEAYALDSAGSWRAISRHAGGARVAVTPFEAAEIALADLWAPT
jgi:Uma2 family endonuclease